MHLSKARYVAICQQLLVLAGVLTLVTAAAGVVNLDMVRPAPAPRDVTPAVTVGDAYVATRPVTPKIRQVAVRGVVTARAPKPATRPTPRFQVAALSAPERVTGLATVGVTWAESDHVGEDQIRISVRTLDGRTWSSWSRLEYHDDHGPDAGSSEGRTERAGTEPTVVGHVQKVQTRTETPTGTAPRNLELVLVDPGAGAVRRAAPAIDTAKLPAPRSVGGDSSSGGSLALSSMRVAPRPKIYSRAQWGADENVRDSGKPQYGTVETGFVHHTVNANNYTREQVPALIRGIYAYHVIARGWRDIGYNFLVDRFGRIWEGRYGGVDKAVVGAHTLGYNEVSFAMSAIGNYDIARPPQGVLDAYAALFAWKLSRYGIRAGATHLWVKNRYLNAINGHRDVGQTACPGRYLYARIPAIRAAAARIQAGVGTTSPPTTPVVPPVGPPITPQPASALPARSSVTGSSWPDLIVRDRATKKILVVPTGGQLGFRTQARARGPWRSYDTVLAAGDLTGDRRGDLFVRDRTTHVWSVLPGDGTGRFSDAVGRTSRFATMRWITAAGDVDRDGRADLVGQDSTGRVLLYPGNGRAGFGTPVVLATTGSYLGGYGIGDFNRDGNPDLVTRSADGRLWFLPGMRSRLGTAKPLPVSLARTDTVSAGDLTGDGTGDLLIRHATGLADLLPGTGTGTVSPVLGPFRVLHDVASATAGSLVHGGPADTVGVATDGTLAVASVNGLANLGAPVDSGDAMPDAGQLLDLGDWNGDGHADLGSRPTGSNYLWFRAGDGRGHWGARIELGKGFKDITTLAAVGDITGDGHPDLVGRARGGMMTIFPGNGRSGLKPAFRAPKRLRSFNQIGVGTWDATVAGSTIGSSDGSFVPYVGTGAAAAVKAPGVAGSYDWVIGAGDVNGDRVNDLIVRERTTGQLWLLPGTGKGFGPRRLIGPGFGGYDLGG